MPHLSFLPAGCAVVDFWYTVTRVYIKGTSKVHQKYIKSGTSALHIHAQEKEDWINAVGRAIVKHSRSLLEHDRGDYTTGGP